MLVALLIPAAALAILFGYIIVAIGVMLAPMLARLVRETRRARRDGRELSFDLLQPYPVYLLRFRRVFLLLLLAPPVFLAGAWIWVKLH